MLQKMPERVIAHRQAVVGQFPEQSSQREIRLLGSAKEPNPFPRHKIGPAAAHLQREATALYPGNGAQALCSLGKRTNSRARSCTASSAGPAVRTIFRIIRSARPTKKPCKKYVDRHIHIQITIGFKRADKGHAGSRHRPIGEALTAADAMLKRISERADIPTFFAQPLTGQQGGANSTAPTVSPKGRAFPSLASTAQKQFPTIARK